MAASSAASAPAVAGSGAVTLSGWTLRDQQSHAYKFDTFKLGAGKSVTVHTRKGTDDRSDFYWGSGVYIWNNDGDKAPLKTGGCQRRSKL